MMQDAQFMKDMDNIADYALGFLDGVQNGKKVLLDTIGQQSVELLKDYVDSSARVNPEMLHHVYEWEQTGSPGARLFDIFHTVRGSTISFKSTFRQSSSIKSGSNVPFANKAAVMEAGRPVTIRPRNSSVLAFEADGQTVFTKNPVTVDNPGGDVAGAYEKALESFFNNYFSQAFLRVSGVAKYLENPEIFAKNLAAGKRGGRAVGLATGFTWIAKAGGTA
jgi:hypothetical protein